MCSLCYRAVQLDSGKSLLHVGDLESELRRIGRIDYRFHLDSELEKCMEMVESVCRESRVQKSVRREVSLTVTNVPSIR